ncbi:unnamed protein product [Urochloa humidicola]
MEAPPPMTTLPLDLLLEIVALTADDVATVVRCAAASKHLRRAMGGAPGLHHLLRLRADAAGGFDPALLLGVSYASRDGLVVPPSGQHLGFDASLLRSSELLSSRDGLLVLRPHSDKRVARVYNAFTGHVTTLLCVDAKGMKWGNGGIYRPAWLAVSGGGGGGASFKVLAMDVCLRARIFSSKDGEWGPIRVVRPPPEPNDHWAFIKHAADKSPSSSGAPCTGSATRRGSARSPTTTCSSSPCTPTARKPRRSSRRRAAAAAWPGAAPWPSPRTGGWAWS